MPLETALTSCRKCGKYFTQRREWQKFCSKLCHNEWHKRELKEAKLALAEKRGQSFAYLLEDKEPDLNDL